MDNSLADGELSSSGKKMALAVLETPEGLAQISHGDLDMSTVLARSVCANAVPAAQPIPSSLPPAEFERRMASASQGLSDSLCSVLDAASGLMGLLCEPASVKVVARALCAKGR